jgi:hypothetical protein
MRKIFLLLSLAVIFFVSKANAQSKFYLSTEANLIYDLYQVTDEGTAAGPSNIRTLDIPGTTILLGYDLNSIFSLEAGIATRPVKTGYSLKYAYGGSKSEGGGLYYHIPVRTRARIPLLGSWLFATASIGAQLSVTNPGRVGTTDIGRSEGRVTTSDGTIIQSTSAQFISYNKYFITAAAETGLDFRIHPKFNVYSTFSYNRGFTDLERADVQYRLENQPERQAFVLHQGSYVSVNIGLRYVFGSGR